MNIKKILTYILLILLLFCSNNLLQAADFNFNTTGLNFNRVLKNISPLLKLDLKNNDLYLPEFHVRGIYVTGWVAGLPERIDQLIRLVNRTNLNTMVIDIKDQRGLISYKSNLDLPRKISANREKIKDIKKLLNKLHKNNIYVIGRIAVFKDHTLAQKRREFALQMYSEKSDIYYNSKNWVFPGDERVWDYNIAVAREAIELGFDEIQFDYIRFPALAQKPISAILPGKKSKSEMINNFINKARKQLADYSTPLSIDVYGLTTSTEDDLGIGQNFAELSKHINIISPMVYPSHYSAGSYGLSVPVKEPYKVVYQSMIDARKKVKDQKDFKIRPWLQDFSIKHEYTFKEVQAQIEALNDLGIKEWLLWNPRSRYTVQALNILAYHKYEDTEENRPENY